MPIYLHPDVYDFEVDLGDQVVSLGQSTAACVFAASQGRVGPYLITGKANRKRLFDEYGDADPTVSLALYTIAAFLDQGNSVWCNRVVNGATTSILASHSGSPDTLISVTASASIDPTNYTFGSSQSFVMYPIGPGTYAASMVVRLTPVAADGSFSIQVLSPSTTVPTAFSVWAFSTAYIVNDVVWSAGYWYICTTAHTSASSGTIDLTKFTSYYMNVLETWTVSKSHQIDGFGRQQFLEDAINTVSNRIRVINNAAVTAAPNADLVLKFGASVASNGTTVGDSAITTGWDQFASQDRFSINILINGGYASVAVHQKMISVAEARVDALALLDMPAASQTTSSAAVTYRTSTLNANSSFGLLCTPNYQIYDAKRDGFIYIPPSGAYARAIALTDNTKNPWWDPAGPRRGKVPDAIKLYVDYSTGDDDLLYPNQINYIRNFTGGGIYIDGQKTLQYHSSPLQSVNVRRLVSLLRVSIRKFLQNFKHEFNDEFTRLQLAQSIASYMKIIKNGRGVYKYKVVCDETNNPPEVIDRSELHVDVYIAPARSAEYIQLQVVVTNSGVNFQALVARGGVF